MATWDDVRRIALALPEAVEEPGHGHARTIAWKVRGKAFAWERPLRASDRRALGDAAPDGPILAARVEHLGAREALLADASGAFFTIPHFDGYPAVLVRLELIAPDVLEEVVAEAWLDRAPKRVAQAWLRDEAERRGDE